MQLVAELLLDRVARSAGAGPLRAADLNHEAGHNSVKDDAVVVADLRQADQIVRVTESHVGIDVEQNLSHRRVELDLIGVLRVIDVLERRVHFGSAIGSKTGHERDLSIEFAPYSPPLTTLGEKGGDRKSHAALLPGMPTSA